MLKSVLESVSDMLGNGLEELGPEEHKLAAAEAYITSAKTLLDKVIEDMDAKIDATIQGVVASETKRKAAVEDIAYKFDVDNGKLLRISYPDGKEVEGEFMVALDGVSMFYREALGKPFQNAKVL